MQTVATKSQVRAAVAAARAQGRVIGLVPTMGALHAGHLALIERSVAECGFTAVSIFVNPTQFGPGEDLERYPRTLPADLQLCEQAGVDLVFAPSAEEMYCADAATTVHVARLTEGLCGAFRPGHFDGVTTVVCKLLNIAQPDRAYFGEKDYQQLVVIRRMVTDLDLSVEVVSVPTVREADGLALSSRNRYLTPEQRAEAPALYRALLSGAEAARRGCSGREVERAVADYLASHPLFCVQYISAVHPHTLEPREDDGLPMVIAAAVLLGDTRLIDNIRIEDEG